MRRFLKFTAASLIGGSVDMLSVWLLSTYVFNGYWGDVVLTPMISFEFAVLVGFIVNRKFVWNDRVDQGDIASFWKSLAAFNMSNITILALRMVLVMVLEGMTDVNLVICNLIARMLAGVLNYVVTDRLIFRNKRHHID